MKLKLTSSQFKLLARYAEDLSKGIALYNVAGYFLPSVLPAALKPSASQFVGGALIALTALVTALILEKKGGK